MRCADVAGFGGGVADVEPAQVLPPGDVGVERRALDERADAGQDATPPRAAWRWPEHLDLAGVGRDQAEQHPDRRRLARPVRAEEAVDRAAGHDEVDRVDGDLRAEAPGQPGRAATGPAGRRAP